jgi:alkylresorcinol/alkylpyrone synthase
LARIVAVATAVPPYSINQSEAIEFAHFHFASKFADIDRLLKIFTSSRVEHRQFCVPKEWFFASHTFEEKNKTYVEWACRLSEQAARKCLAKAGIGHHEVDHIIFVSTTGLATPSIDARLINMLGLRTDISRVPVWGLGCVGGSVGLAMAHDYIKAYPNSKVLLVAVELCSLTFQFGDLGKSNLVATALFGDGAAAVLLDGEQGGMEIIDSQSTFWPDSLDVMGWNVLNEGLQVVFARAIPAIVSKYAHDNIASFIAKHDLTLKDIEHYIFHPGGAKVIDAYRDALCLGPDGLADSETVLREHGNMSSVTILYALERFFYSDNNKPNAYGLFSALGPGFSSQSLLFRT